VSIICAVGGVALKARANLCKDRRHAACCRGPRAHRHELPSAQDEDLAQYHWCGRHSWTLTAHKVDGEGRPGRQELMQPTAPSASEDVAKRTRQLLLARKRRGGKGDMERSGQVKGSKVEQTAVDRGPGGRDRAPSRPRRAWRAHGRRQPPAGAAGEPLRRQRAAPPPRHHRCLW